MQKGEQGLKSDFVGDARFQSTRWSIVLEAGHRSSPDSSEALATLCRIYWYPFYAYVRCRVRDVHEAQDLTQAFFAQLLEKNYVAEAEPERGKFRSFLLTSFKHFLSKEWDKAKAQKRGAGRAPISLDFSSGETRYLLEPADELTPERIYDRQWALTLLERVLDRLNEEFVRARKRKLFEQLKVFIAGEGAPISYAEVAGQLGISEGAAKVAAHRMRRRYREILREEIAQTVAEPSQVEDEIRSLFDTLGSPQSKRNPRS